MKHYHESLAHLKYWFDYRFNYSSVLVADMKKDLKDYIARCPNANSTDLPLGLTPRCQFRPVPPVALPFERWGIDFYGPMVETKSGIREMTEAAVATFLYDLMMTYGAPFEIISDRGKSFLAEGISEFERENSIRHLATTPYHPQTNGMVERMHAMLGHGLTTLVADKRDRWDEYLPQRKLVQARSAANVRTKAQAEAMRKRNGLRRKHSDYYFKVGDMVKMKHHDRQKLEFNWKGPYHVVDVGIQELTGL
ncbi:hypothetical protein BASA83_011556 [Batrachochytrium salamandrivorans]|nr:hypothetical protein BASA83_011556 [Batrachochytrium salamandrivorans]